MNITLKQIRLFLSVARHSNFTRAARAEGISQPALTVQIRQLEEELGLKMFDRTTRSVALSKDGTLIATQFQRLIHDFDDIVTSARNRSPSARETVNIACIPSLAGRIVPDVIARFRKESPEVEVFLKDTAMQGVVAAVRKGEAKIAIGAGRYVKAGVQFLSLGEDILNVVFPRGHPLEDYDTVPLTELAPFPLIITNKNTSVRTTFEDYLIEWGTLIVPRYEVEKFASAMGMVRAGLGITILPSSATELVADDEIDFRPLSGIVRSIMLMMREDEPLTPSCERLVEMLMEKFRSMKNSHLEGAHPDPIHQVPRPNT